MKDSPQILPEDRVVASVDVLFEKLEGEGVLLNLASGLYFGLDDVGTRMWELLTEHGVMESAVTELLGEYEVEEETLRRDVGGLVAELRDAGLVTIEKRSGEESQATS